MAPPKASSQVAPPSPTIMFCPRCFRAGDDVGTCTDKVLGCPTPKPVDPKTMAVLQCIPCDKTVAVTVAAIMSNKLPSGGVYCSGDCDVDKCKAFILKKV